MRLINIDGKFINPEHIVLIEESDFNYPTGKIAPGDIYGEKTRNKGKGVSIFFSNGEKLVVQADLAKVLALIDQPA